MTVFRLGLRPRAWAARAGGLVLCLLLAAQAVSGQAGKEPGDKAKADKREEEILARLVKAKRVGPRGEKKGKGRGDDQFAAARYLRKLRGATEGGDPLKAMPRAINRVREMRLEVAAKSGVHPSVMAALAARGVQVATVAGIPVGPLAADSPAALAIPLSATNYKSLSKADVTLLDRTVRPSAVPLSSLVSPNGWVWLGPANVGGRTRALLIHPNKPSIMWVAGVAGGIWTTTDNGVTWAPYKGFMASLIVSCMALNPKSPDVLYAGTGEGLYNLDAMRGVGIFQSQNGGSTWSPLEGTKEKEEFRWVNRLAVSPDGKTLLAATRAGVFSAAPDGKVFTRAKLADGAGGTVPFGVECLDLRFHPSDPLRAVAGGRNGRAWYTNDGGATWQPAKGLAEVAGEYEGRVELAYAAADPKYVYAAVDDLAFTKEEDGEKVPYNGLIYLSTDGGENFTPRGKPGHLAGQGWYANCLWAGDPIDPNLLIVGGLDLHRSTNGGKGFVPISDWENTPTSPHADHHVIVAHPGYDGNANRRVYFGSDGGAYVTDDITLAGVTSGWRSLNNGLGITQFYGAAAHPKTGKIIAGAQDNGTLVYTPPQVPSVPHQGVSGWFDHGLDGLKYSGDGSYCAVDPEGGLFFGGYVHLRVHRSDGSSGYKSIDATIGDARREGLSLFIAPIALCEDDPKVMYACGARVWRCKDVRADSPEFEYVKGFLLKDSDEDVFTLTSAVAVQKGDPKVVWVGYELNRDDPDNSGAVFRTNDANASQPQWERLGKGQLPARHCTRIVLDPKDPLTAYALFGGYFKDNVWRTTDGGKEWNSVGAKVLPEAPVYDLALHPDDSKVLILGTECGLFVSDNAGADWAPTSGGPTNCAVYQLFWTGKKLTAVTHGRGLFTIDLTRGRVVTRNAPPARPAPKAIQP